MISMAGGDFVFKNLSVTGSMPITSQHSALAEFKAVRAGAVWCFQPWWWQALDRSDEIVADLAAILHPELFPGHVLNLFFKLSP
ncbi:hypothetical protein Dvar_48390 [Desulfosarcina variabilis str. Montpellier]|uniref:hypothetical protein n=1 Tax=Desulfosarcina variabilis TaxID=2300 RepID=UPI003AFADB97